MRVAGNLLADTRITLEIRRGAETIALEVTVGKRPENVSLR